MWKIRRALLVVMRSDSGGGGKNMIGDWLERFAFKLCCLAGFASTVHDLLFLCLLCTLGFGLHFVEGMC